MENIVDINEVKNNKFPEEVKIAGADELKDLEPASTGLTFDYDPTDPDSLSMKYKNIPVDNLIEPEFEYEKDTEGELAASEPVSRPDPFKTPKYYSEGMDYGDGSQLPTPKPNAVWHDINYSGREFGPRVSDLYSEFVPDRFIKHLTESEKFEEAKKGQVTFSEIFTEDYIEFERNIPFFMGHIQSIQDDIQFNRAQKVLQDPNALMADIEVAARIYNERIRKQEIFSVRGSTYWSDVGVNLAFLPSFLVDIGVANALKLPMMAAPYVRTMFGPMRSIVQSKLALGATRFIGGLVGQAIVTAANPMRIAEEYYQHLNDKIVTATDGGRKIIEDWSKVETPAFDLFRAMASVFGDFYFETLGGPLLKGLKKIPIIKAAGRLPIFRNVQKVLDKLDDIKGVKATKKFLDKKLNFDWLGEEPEEIMQRMYEATSGLQYQVERPADQNFYSPEAIRDRLVQSIPSWKEFWVEISVLAFAGMGSAALAYPVNRMIEERYRGGFRNYGINFNEGQANSFSRFMQMITKRGSKDEAFLGNEPIGPEARTKAEHDDFLDQVDQTEKNTENSIRQNVKTDRLTEEEGAAINDNIMEWKKQLQRGEISIGEYNRRLEHVLNHSIILQKGTVEEARDLVSKGTVKVPGVEDIDKTVIEGKGGIRVTVVKGDKGWHTTLYDTKTKQTISENIFATKEEAVAWGNEVLGEAPTKTEATTDKDQLTLDLEKEKEKITPEEQKKQDESTKIPAYEKKDGGPFKPSEKRTISHEAYEAALNRLNEKGQLRLKGIVPSRIQDLFTVGLHALESGINKPIDWSKEMLSKVANATTEQLDKVWEKLAGPPGDRAATKAFHNALEKAGVYNLWRMTDKNYPGGMNQWLIDNARLIKNLLSDPLNLNEMKGYTFDPQTQAAIISKGLDNLSAKINFSAEEYEQFTAALRSMRKFFERNPDIAEKLRSDLANQQTPNEYRSMFDRQGGLIRWTKPMEATLKQTEKAVEDIKKIAASKGVNIASVEYINESKEIDPNNPEDYVLLLAQGLTEKEIEDAKRRGAVFTIRGEQEGILGDDGKRRSYIKIFLHHNTYDIYHEMAHAFRDQGYFTNWYGSEEAIAQYIGEQLDMGRSIDEIMEDNPDFSKEMPDPEIVSDKSNSEYPDYTGNEEGGAQLDFFNYGKFFSIRENDPAKDLAKTLRQLGKIIPQVMGAGNIPAISKADIKQVNKLQDSITKFIADNPRLFFIRDQSAMVANSEYGVNADFENICPRGYSFSIILNQMRSTLDKFDWKFDPTTKEGKDKLNAIKTAAGRKLMEMGVDIHLVHPCLQCYVAEKRISGFNARSTEPGLALYEEGELTDAIRDTVLEFGGVVRGYSFGDFAPAHFPSLINLLKDIAKRRDLIGMGLYTKNLNLVEILADVGIAINISVGKNNKIGIPVEIADIYAKRYKNVAVNYVAINEADLEIAGADPRVHKIIPVHIGGGLPRKNLDMMSKDKWYNFQKFQDDKITFTVKMFDKKTGEPVINKKTGKQRERTANVKIFGKSAMTYAQSIGPEKVKALLEARAIIKKATWTGNSKKYLAAVKEGSKIFGQKIAPKFEPWSGKPWYHKLIGSGPAEYGKGVMNKKDNKIDLTKVNIKKAEKYFEEFNTIHDEQIKEWSKIERKVRKVAQSGNENAVAQMPTSNWARSVVKQNSVREYQKEELIKEALKYDTKEEFISDKLSSVADMQRNKPESSRLPAEKISTWHLDILEVAGDLIHRTFESGFLAQGGYGGQKVQMLTDRFKEARYAERLDEELQKRLKWDHSQGQFLDETVESRRAEWDVIRANYASEYKKLPAYNEIQRLAREIPIAVAENRYNDAFIALRKIAIMRKDFKAWTKELNRSDILTEIWNDAQNKKQFSIRELVYRGSNAVTGEGLKQGNLGSGFYVTNKGDRGMAKAFADMHKNGVVTAYQIDPKANLLDADSEQFIAIKEKYGLEYWEAPPFKGLSDNISKDVRALGYDGVRSMDRATGIVIYDKKFLLNPNDAIFTYQDTNQEMLIQNSSLEKGQLFMATMMHAGDAFRGLASSKADDTIGGYTLSKLDKIEDFITGYDSYFAVSKLTPKDTYDISQNTVDVKGRPSKEIFNKLLKQWNDQPYATSAQKLAIDLNKDLIKGDFTSAMENINDLRQMIDYPLQAKLNPAKARPTRIEGDIYKDFDMDIDDLLEAHRANPFVERKVIGIMQRIRESGFQDTTVDVDIGPNGRMKIVDGNNTLEALRRLGEKFIRVDAKILKGGNTDLLIVPQGKSIRSFNRKAMEATSIWKDRQFSIREQNKRQPLTVEETSFGLVQMYNDDIIIFGGTRTQGLSADSQGSKLHYTIFDRQKLNSKGEATQVGSADLVISNKDNSVVGITSLDIDKSSQGRIGPKVWNALRETYPDNAIRINDVQNPKLTDKVMERLGAERIASTTGVDYQFKSLNEEIDDEESKTSDRSIKRRKDRVAGKAGPQYSVRELDRPSSEVKNGFIFPEGKGADFASKDPKGAYIETHDELAKALGYESADHLLLTSYGMRIYNWAGMVGYEYDKHNRHAIDMIQDHYIRQNIAGYREVTIEIRGGGYKSYDPVNFLDDLLFYGPPESSRKMYSIREKTFTVDEVLHKMVTQTEGQLGVGAIRDYLKTESKVWVERDIPLEIVQTPDLDEVDVAKVKPEKGSVILDSNNVVIDGRHRVVAARQRGDATIKALVPQSKQYSIREEVKFDKKITMAGKEELQELGFSPAAQGFGGMADVRWINGKPAVAYSWVDEALAGFAVHPDFQNKGIASKVLEDLLIYHGELKVIDPNKKLLSIMWKIGEVSPMDSSGIVTLTQKDEDIRGEKERFGREQDRKGKALLQYVLDLPQVSRKEMLELARQMVEAGFMNKNQLLKAQKMGDLPLNLFLSSISLDALSDMGEYPQYSIRESDQLNIWDDMGPEEEAEPVKPETTASPKDSSTYSRETEQIATGIKNAEVDRVRESFGYLPATRGEKLSREQALSQAQDIIDKNPLYGKNLVDELIGQPRAVSPQEVAVIIIEARRAQNNRDIALEALNEARESGDATEIKKASDTLMGWQNEYVIFSDMTAQIGTIQSYAFALRQMMLLDDFSIAKMSALLSSEENDGGPLNAGQAATVADHYERISKARAASEAASAKAAAERRISELEQEVKLLNLEVEAKRLAAMPFSEVLVTKFQRYVDDTEKEYEESQKDFNDILKRIGGTVGTKALDPKVLKHLLITARYYSLRATLSVTKLTKILVDKYGPNVTKYVQKVWDTLEGATEAAFDKSLGIAKTPEQKAEKARIKAERREKTKRDPEDLAAKRDRALKTIKEKNDNLKDDHTLDIYFQVRTIARYHATEGITEREPLMEAVHNDMLTVMPEITLNETAEAFAGYGRYKAASKDEITMILTDISGQERELAKQRDIEAGRRVKPSGVGRQKKSDKERRMIARTNEMKRQYGVVSSTAENSIQSALGAIQTHLKNMISDMLYQLETGVELMKNKTKVQYDLETRILREDYLAVKALFDKAFGKDKLSEEKRLAAAMKAVERSTASLEKRLSANDLKAIERKPRVNETPALAAARANRNTLQRIMILLRSISKLQKELEVGREVKKAKPAEGPGAERVEELKAEQERLKAEIFEKYRDEIASNALIARMASKKAELLAKMARGEYLPTERRRVQLNQSALQAKQEYELAMAEWNAYVIQKRIENEGKVERAWRRTSEVLNTSRAILTGLDLSAAFRQGGFIALGNPLELIDTIPVMLRAFASKNGALASEQEIASRKNAYLYKEAGLALSQRGHNLIDMEEAYMSRWADKIPLIAGSSRAYGTFLNRMRADTFDRLVEKLGKSGTVTLEEAKAIASFVNAATGRGNVTIGKKTVVGLSTVFFAPRYVASRIQLMLGTPLWGNSWRTNKYVAWEYAKFLIAIGTIFGMSMMAWGDDDDFSLKWHVFEIDEDGIPHWSPDLLSKDFGKLVFGDTRVDLLAGLQQITVLAAQTAWGYQEKRSGQIVPTRGPNVAYGDPDGLDVFARFVRTKLSPWVGAIVDNVLTGMHIGGGEATLLSTVENMAVPISIRDIWQVMANQNIPTGVILSILSIFGVSIQTYDEEKRGLLEILLQDVILNEN